MIKIQNVSYQYDGCGIPALKNISLEINKGEYIALIGPNGCGKTTLIRLLNALIRPNAGVVTIDGLDTNVAANHKEIRRAVGMLFQNPDNQIVGMTVEEDIAFGPGNLNWPPQEIRRQVGEILKNLGLQSLAQRAPHTLSGGEKRLVSLAGVLIMNPRYIAFDEPTAYLDPVGRRRVLQMMDRLHGEGIGIIHITHDVNDMADADRLLVMDKGEIILDGPPRDILRKMAENPDSFISPPPVMELMYQLKRRGWPLTPDILSTEDAEREIHHLLTSLHKEQP
ncbi:MAG: ATP-binding cassette domain-containing protein [Syntrophaceae bacterium]|nr:ATP-binding cassette domain-containing protein [Syntrophaceae bacterium]